jgi:glycosyltransferase involved in cell wall biosynthesis
MSAPLVSVITSNFNGAVYLPDSITSMLNQRFDSWEHIIVDCGSTDNSRQVLESLNHPRLRIIHENFCGVSRARNIAIRNARGAFCAILDADDLALPNRLSLQMDLLRKHPEVVAVGGDCKAIIMRDRLWKKALLPNNRKFHLPCQHDEIMLFLYAGLTPIMHSTLTFRKISFHEIGGYRETIEKAEDFDLILRMGLHGRLASVPEQVCIVRAGVDSSHTTRHRPHGRDALYYVFLSILDNFASANCVNYLQQDIEAWLDGIGKQGLLAVQGRWIWNALLNRKWRMSRAAGAIILRAFLRRLPAIFACRNKPWWSAARSPETVLKAIMDLKIRDAKGSNF